MIRALDVYLLEHCVGKLIQDEHGQCTFIYSEEWLNHPKATPLSCSLPLRAEQFSQKECRGFFSGILPEENKRKIIASNLGISAKNDFAMLERIGGECAGAVTFVPSETSFSIKKHNYRKLSATSLAKILRALPRRPLMAGDKGIRLSLAGAQDKIAVYVLESQISVPLDTAPSTHIIKPAIEQFRGIVLNEAFCLQLASKILLPAAKAEIRQAEDIEYLLIERYDRIYNLENKVHRLHQEDFCQALGIPPETKYQSEGGPGLKQCFQLIREYSSAPVLDLQRLLDAVVFNFLIGNNDAHGKNFSLLYSSNGNIELAPLYDLISTIYYPELSNKMAMKIGAQNDANKLTGRDFGEFASDAKLSERLVIARVRELAENMMSALPELAGENQVAADLAKLIGARAKRALQAISSKP